MKRRIILTKKNAHIMTTVIENDKIVEINCCREEDITPYSVGNIYVGKVKNIVSNIGAAFIEIQKGVMCYYKMEEMPLRIGDELLVQITREPAKGKVASVSASWSLRGRYVVLSAGESKVGVSTKIVKDKQRDLREFASAYLAEGYGIIVRTNAISATREEIEEELKLLIIQYKQIMAIADKRTCYTCIHRGPMQYLADLQNVRREGLEEIKVEDTKLYEEVLAYLKVVQPDMVGLLKRYEDSLLTLHKLYSIDVAIEEALKEKVWLKSGAYLMIQPTEACTVIDINTGKAIRRKDESLNINLEAAKEIARQIRLRNLSGIVLVDFINLSKAEEVRQLLKAFEHFLKQDPISTTLVDMTKLQLVEITRKRIRKPLAESIAL
jgi:Ribonucleases G and E